MKDRLWIDFPEPFGGYFEMWWFPKDNLNHERKGRGYWQIGGHFFTNNPFLETAFSLGRYAGYWLANLFIHLDWRDKKPFSLFLKILLHRKNNGRH